jgi:hypothetical protein
MKAISLAFGFALLLLTGTLAQAAQPRLISIHPLQEPKSIAGDGLYLVTVICRVQPSPEQRVNLFEKKVRESSLTVTLANARAGANQAPAANAVLAAIPVFAATISTIPPPSMFKNDGCNQSLLITGRTPLYVTGVWTDQQGFAPTPLTAAITSLAGLISPLGVLFPTGPANLIKADTGIANSMSGPFSQLVSATNWSATQTETTAELKETTYAVSAKYFTASSWTGDGTTSPAATVSISIKRITSIKSALVIQAINAAFENALQTFAAQVQKDPTTCIAIGRALELNQNLSHPDAVYALARIVVYSAIPSNKVTTCLGKTYGPEVIQDGFWKQNSHMTLTPESFPEEINLGTGVPFSPPIFDQITKVMTDYVAGKHNDVEINKWFGPKIDIWSDTTGLTDGTSDHSMEEILDKLKGANYLYYGCAKPDNAADPRNVQDVGYILAIDKSLKPEKMLIMRVWWKLDEKSTNAQPLFYQISLGSEADLVKTTLTADNNQCGLQVIIPAK